MHTEVAWMRIQFRKRNICNGPFPTHSSSLSLSSPIPAHFCAWVEQLFHWTWPTEIMQRFNHKYFGSWNRIKSTFIFKLQNLHEHFSSRCACIFFPANCLLQSHLLGYGDDDAAMRLTDYTCVLAFVNICSIFNTLKIVACRLWLWILCIFLLLRFSWPIICRSTQCIYYSAVTMALFFLRSFSNYFWIRNSDSLQFGKKNILNAFSMKFPWSGDFFPLKIPKTLAIGWKPKWICLVKVTIESFDINFYSPFELFISVHFVDTVAKQPPANTKHRILLDFLNLHSILSANEM